MFTRLAKFTVLALCVLSVAARTVQLDAKVFFMLPIFQPILNRVIYKTRQVEESALRRNLLADGVRSCMIERVRGLAEKRSNVPVCATHRVSAHSATSTYA